MSKYAPTLFIGLGGSGVKVLRWLRQAIYSGLPEIERDREPVAFLGIDFDPSSNRATEKLEPLGATEFRYYDPSSIAATVNNIDREREPDDDGKERWEFPEIRDWYPDPEQKVIRYAQTEATGAAQWRPLGRIGFFLNDREIHDAIAEALTELDRRRGSSVQPGEQPTVVIASSVAGGTGSSILFDVAVAARKIRHGVSVRAFLMLPELFEQIDFRDRVFPNAYATLWEVAALKNQHVVFNARYPRIPPVTRADSPPPFQRVFLVGPWVGERKPFNEPDDVFPFVAQLLRMSITPEVRAAALSAEANASADSGAPLTDPTSLHVFCAMSAMAIRLLTYAELADLVMRRFLEELNPERERPLLDILSPGRAASNPAGELVDWIETAASGNDTAFALTQTYRELELARFMRERDSYRSSWSVADLEKIRHDVRRFCGTDPSAPLLEPPELLTRIRADFAKRLEERLATVADESTHHPRAFEGFLTRLERQLPELRSRKPLPDLQNIDNFERWLDTGAIWGSLAQQLTPSRLDRLHDEARAWFSKTPTEGDYKLWLRQAIENAARDVIRKLRQHEETRWEKVEELRHVAARLLANTVEPIEERAEQIFLDGRRSDAARVLERELARFDSTRRRAFHRRLMADFQSFYDEYREAGEDAPVTHWIRTTRRLFERELAVVAPDDTDTRGAYYRLISPESLFADHEVTSAMLRCRNRIFQPGRVASPAALRIARLLVPQGFRNRDTYHTKMRNWSKGLLNATTSSLQANGSATEDRIVVVVEDLFHPAEDINGVYDYHAQYATQHDRRLFHIHREWPLLFPPLITRAGDRSRIPCGNPGCDADIRTLPRTRLFCPRCDQPIRNRCGNARCIATDLADRPDRDRFTESRTCPVCRGFLWTSWWKCAEHGDVPMDKPNCPECVRTGRPRHRISARPDRLNRFVCPTCTARKKAPPFSATGAAARYLIDGVNGHDLVDAQNEFRRILARGAFCPECAAQLAPECPIPDIEHPERPHYLYRHRDETGVDRFRCYLHTDTELFTCGHCDFPMLSDATRCARCGNELTDCRYCTPLFHVRVPRPATPEDRCPNCHASAASVAGIDDDARLRPAPGDDSFCSNIFGCVAGGHLHDTTFPPHVDVCPLCHHTELPLRRVFTRENHLKACRYCSDLFGIQVTAGERASYRAQSDHCCCLCGRTYTAVDALSEDELKQLVAIGCILRCTADDEDALRQLLARRGVESSRLESLDKELQAFVRSIKRPAVRHVVAARLEHVLAFYERQFGCRADSSQHGSDRCDC